MNASKRGTPTVWTDPDDAPELTDEFFEQADECVGDKLIRRGRPASNHKTTTTIRFDNEVIDASKSTGKS